MLGGILEAGKMCGARACNGADNCVGTGAGRDSGRRCGVQVLVLVLTMVLVQVLGGILEEDVGYRCLYWC